MNSQSNGHGEYKIVLVGSVNSDLKAFHQQLMEKEREPPSSRPFKSFMIDYARIRTVSVKSFTGFLC